MSETASVNRMKALAELELKPVGAQPGFFRGTMASVRDIVGHRELLGLLINRELRARYKDSSLGFIWSLFKPITQMMIYYLVLGQFLQMARGIPEFAIFVFSGLTIWTLFNEIVGGGTGSIVANSGLVKKVYLPREIFPLATVGSSLVNFAIQFGVLLLGTVLVLDLPRGTNLVYVPLAIVLVVVFATALALLMSALNVYLRDVQHLMEIVMMLLFWASPIVYGYRYVYEFFGSGWLNELYLANPVTLAVLAFQRGIWVAGADQPFPDHMSLRMLIALAVSIALLWISQRIFARLEGNFAQEL
ncbi:ABC transporter permease [Sanguibacter sp. 25GB23B1]|uniref:ABC transporter permease n=1 Tax=unclassified Sanguibacter TaxID=2645534 RepID=UPI0032AE8C2E